MPKMKIGVNMGATVQINKGPISDFLKPEVTAELTFESVPTEEKLKEWWDYLFTNQLAPQFAELLNLMVRQTLTKPESETDV